MRKAATQAEAHDTARVISDGEEGIKTMVTDCDLPMRVTGRFRKKGCPTPSSSEEGNNVKDLNQPRSKFNNSPQRRSH